MIASPLLDLVSTTLSVAGVVAIIAGLTSLYSLLYVAKRAVSFPLELRVRRAELRVRELNAEAELRLARAALQEREAQLGWRITELAVDDESFALDPDDPRDVARLVASIELERDARRRATGRMAQEE